jgi:hypothetical protein
MKPHKAYYPVKAIYNPDTGKIEYSSVHSMKGDVVKKLKINRVGGYMNVYTDEKDRDLHHEFFDKNTDFMDEFGWSMVGKPILINHGMDEAFKSMHVGVFDFETEDEVGRYVEGRLFEQEEYEEMLSKYSQRKGLNWTPDEIKRRAALAHKTVQAFFSTGKAHWSSGALPQEVEVNPDNGHVERWPRIEGSATLTPAEPDGTEITTKSLAPEFEASLKAAFELLDAVLNEHLLLPAHPSKEAQPIENEADKSVTQQDNPESTPSKGKNNMDAMAFLNQLATMLAEFIAGAGEQPEAAVAMADEVVDEMKAEAEALPEEEKAKAMDEELVKAWMGKAIAKTEAKLAKKQALATVAKSEAQKALDAWKAKQPVSEEAARGLPRYTGGNGRVQVGDNLKYAHLTAQEMAMVWKMSVAASGLGVRGLQGRNATEFVSEEFYKAAMHKMVAQTERAPLSRSHEDLEVKSAMPFKANELNASDITGQGLEWLGYAYDSQVWEAARNNLVYKEMLARGMIEKPVAQGEKGAYVPIESDDLPVYGGVEGNSVDSTGRPEVVYKVTPQTTSTVLVTPGTFRTATAYTFTLGEDSFVDMAQEANRKVRIALEENIEKAMINADSDASANTNINKIDGTPTSTGLTKDYYLEFDGLRKSPLVTSTSQSVAGTTLSFDNYANTWALLGSTIAPRKENIFFLIDFSTFQASIKLLPRLTKDVAGDEAALFTGEMNNLWGIPVLMSGFLAKSNTAGKISVTAGNNTKGQILAVYAPYWAFVFKRALTIEMQRSPDSESFEFYGSMRFALKRRSALAAAMTYGLTV